MRKTYFLIVVSFFLSPSIIAQTSDVDSLYQWFDQILGEGNQNVYNGPIYQIRRISKTTHAYFQSDKWENASVVIGEEVYSNIPVLFDISNNLLIAKHPDPLYTHGIAIKNVQAFTIFDKQFVLKDGYGLSKGYYQILFQGQDYELVALRRKKDDIVSGAVIFDQKDDYFLRTKEKFQPISTYKSLTQLLPMEKSELRQIKKQHKLKPSAKREADLVKFIELVDM